MTRALVAGDSMLKDLAGSFTLSSRTHVEVHSFSGVRIEKLFSIIAHSLADVHVVVLHVGTNNVGEEPLVLIAKFRSLIFRIIDVNPSIRAVVSAILPRQASLRKFQWALFVGELEAFNMDAGKTNAILQVLCHKNGYGFVDGTRELMGILKADGVHPTKCDSQDILDLCRRVDPTMVETDKHKVTKARRTAVPLCSAAFEQSPASDCWPPDACGVTCTVSPQSEGVVLRKGCSVADTSASSLRGDHHVEKEVKAENKKGSSNKKPVSPALVSAASVPHKVTKARRTAVPLCSAAFEQSPASDCGPPDACGVTSTVSPQSESVVLRKGRSGADTSTSSPRGEDPEQEQKAKSAKLPHSHICRGGGNLSVGSKFST
ncbi:hypothetical protein HPB51_011211 [Rhipicephalus microplus]|uniref:Uncharacterized protein n=1 Tax=Rhipicephalus microplus TaxID=6941 RepID=A0A9J6F1K2_RHIMP|nr:hypothetical protein HPB51_011211 [Rhipicephalus microplus]